MKTHTSSSSSAWKCSSMRRRLIHRGWCIPQAPTGICCEWMQRTDCAPWPESDSLIRWSGPRRLPEQWWWIGQDYRSAKCILPEAAKSGFTLDRRHLL